MGSGFAEDTQFCANERAPRSEVFPFLMFAACVGGGEIKNTFAGHDSLLRTQLKRLVPLFAAPLSFAWPLSRGGNVSVFGVTRGGRRAVTPSHLSNIKRTLRFNNIIVTSIPL